MKTYVPQADDLGKIEDLPLAVEDGKRSIDSLSSRYQFDPRQSLYYVEAASELGLIVRKGGLCSLTTLGMKYVEYSQDQRTKMLTKLILRLPIFKAILAELRRRPYPSVSRADLVRLLSAKADLSESTARRRVQTVLKWLSWVAGKTKVFKITENSVSIRDPSKRTG